MTEADRTEPAATERLGQAERVAIDVARALEDAKCDDILVIDVTDLSQVMDRLVIASGTSDRQMRSAAEDAAEAAEALGESVFGRSEDAASTWIIIDLVDVVVHIFEPNARAFYDLETLWGDGPRVHWQRENGDRAGGGSSRAT